MRDEQLDDPVLLALRDARPASQAPEESATSPHARLILERAMASGPRRAFTKPTRRPLTRWRRWIVPVTSALVTVAVVVVAAGVLGHRSYSVPAATPPGRTATGPAAAVVALLQGIQESHDVLGRTSAPVTVTLYGDLESPITADLANGALARLIQGSVRAGHVKLAFSAVCTSSCKPRTPMTTFDRQQAAALAAGEQSQFWDYALLFFKKQGKDGTNYVTPRFLDGLARDLPALDDAKWSSARSAPALTHTVRSQQAAAKQALRILQTPTVAASGPKGRSTLTPGAHPLSLHQLTALVNRVS
jgi:protein-disulfide isomerase